MCDAGAPLPREGGTGSRFRHRMCAARQAAPPSRRPARRPLEPSNAAAKAPVMEIKFVLDFDGVLFNSAFEAFSVSNRATAGRAQFRQDITYEEFLSYRAVVTDAWQYNRLYSREHSLPA